ncbi:MAG TPA: ATP-binding protein, partial [Candidatus Paceibacterota bacterium]|nr:ATP-binding protein [Candidatus Paceibacterota bacterium]
IEHDLEGFGDQRLNPVLEKAVSATELTDMLAKSVQRIAAELRPGILDRLGLVMALSYEADQFHQRTGLACQIRVPEEEITLPNESVTAVFRIFQEAMTNIARHAEASEVNIDFRLESDSLVLEVRDNGKGIKPGDLVGDRSLGVLGMKERARQMDADISFKPSPNGGTVVTLRIPYHHSRIEAHQPSAALCSK